MKPGFGMWDKGIDESQEENWEGWPPPGSLVRVREGKSSKEVEVVLLHWLFGEQVAQVRMWYWDKDEYEFDVRRPMYLSYYLPEMEILSVPPESIGQADWRRGLVGRDREAEDWLCPPEQRAAGRPG